ncbi:MAG: exodeoxyribonuclease V subunit beta [Lysobacteraceae bacterium]|nr:MAG: exodeoxyribonuclease V subunit beta [Xanthomonadaceae bacterium]
MTDAARDLGLDLPLHGLQLVEASAGTGKTFTLATLYARLVIELKLPVSSLLAVTFTDAATQELRTRIRERLQLAAGIADGEPVDPSKADHVITQVLVQAALAHEPVARLRLRLRQAAEQMDLAPVYTIHGFCRRALADHAIEAGHAPGDVELVKNERSLREEVATDLWRMVCQDADDAGALMALWASPADMAASLRDLVNVDVLLPEDVAPDVAAEKELRAALAEAARSVALGYQAHGAETKRQLDAAINAGWMHASHFSSARLQLGWQTLHAWVIGGCIGAPAGNDDDRKRLLLAGDEQIQAKTNKAHRAETALISNPFTKAVDQWEWLRRKVVEFDSQRRIRLVHRLRRDAAGQLARLKRERRLQGFDDLIRSLATALAGQHGQRLAECLRAQYRIALLDEFQDTDPQQWDIFRRVFAQAPEDGLPRALFLIGDPKQAIYRFRGGDVFTYLDAAKQAEGHATLAQNFRSRPLALQAVQALYADAGATPFGEAGISFVPVGAGGSVADDALRLDGAVAPALHVLALPDAPSGVYSADGGRAAAATACVATVRQLLSDGYATCREAKQMRAVRPGDIAVLVQSHRESRLMQRTLARAGVPFVAQGRDSLYASSEAQDLLTLLEACLHLADDSRLRGALATSLIGLDAAALAALDSDGQGHRLWQDRALGWRTRWEKHGPLALVTDLCAANAPRLLALDDGERRLTNWLQLAESLQSEGSGHDSPAVLALLRQRIADADADNDEELMRLESDAARVRVLTLHKSKGLEFPIVMLPFLSQAGSSAPRGGLALARFHDGVRRVARMKAGDDAAYKEASDRDKAETRAEKLRLLYVGLTRARLATWVCFGPTKDALDTPLADLLFGAERVVKPESLSAAAIRERLDALALSAPAAIRVADAALAVPPGAPALEAPMALPPAAQPVRYFARDWWVHSFSGLAREAGGAEERRAADESEPLLPGSRFAGARFGNVLHEALEEVDFAAWRDAGDAPPAGQSAALERALRNGGYGTPNDLAEGVPLLAKLVFHTLNVSLPEGVRLCDLPSAQRRPEMEFHFSLAPARLDAVLALMHGHGLVVARQAFGKRERLEGLMTGFIDLVYEHAGRFHVLDYKSNQLPDYGPDTLADAMAHSEYDLQYLLYTLALHRWLRFRLPGYDYDRHFGGVRYLFCRGLDSSRADSPGIHASTPPRALVEALDALLLPTAAQDA